MSKSSKLFLAVVMASSLALAAIGVAHAQTDTVTSAVADTQVSASTATLADQSAHNGLGGRHQERLEEQATLFNMSVEDLEKEIEAGKPMYQVAAEHGVTYDTMKSHRLSEFKTRLDDMVKVGYMSQAQADEIYQNAQAQPMMDGLGFGSGKHGMQ
ncbi:MAG: hypothetical protein WCT27_01285 [Patescibacteria group bacterium]|jgi:hypothetical protein